MRADRISAARRHARKVLDGCFAQSRGVRHISSREVRSIFACAFDSALASYALEEGGL
jgi:hypothetical protein